MICILFHVYFTSTTIITFFKKKNKQFNGDNNCDLCLVLCSEDFPDFPFIFLLYIFHSFRSSVLLHSYVKMRKKSIFYSFTVFFTIIFTLEDLLSFSYFHISSFWANFGFFFVIFENSLTQMFNLHCILWHKLTV